MTEMKAVLAEFDFEHLHAAMQKYVDLEILAGVSSAVLVGNDLVDVHSAGWADREADIPLAENHIFRMYSSTKLVTSIAVLMLFEAGHFQLDDPVEKYIPELGDRQVVKSNANNPMDSEPAQSSISIRHLMTHTSGLIAAFLEPDSPLSQLYVAHKVANPHSSLADMIDALSSIPLGFHPGTAWNYSPATDVLGRLVEIISGQKFGDFLEERIFHPLGMVDTGFWVRPAKHDRLVAYYAGADLMDPMKSGLTRLQDVPYPNAYLAEPKRQSGSGGLVSTLRDSIALLKGLIGGNGTLLQPETMELVQTNQLPDGMNIQFQGLGVLPGKGHGLASGVSMAPLPNESKYVTGEYGWSGLAGTHWWVSPSHNLAVVILAQREMGGFHPFVHELKSHIYEAVVG